MSGKFDFDCPCVFSFNLKGGNDAFNVHENEEWFKYHHTEHDANDVENSLEEYPLRNSESLENVAVKESLVATIKSKEASKSELVRLKPAVKNSDPPRNAKVVTTAARVTAPAKPKPTVAPSSSASRSRTVPVPASKPHIDKKPTAAVTVKGKPNPSTSSSSCVCEDDIMQMLKQHNKNTAPPVVYEPARYSVREVRKWEKVSGKLWADLNPKEREEANAAIELMKRSEVQ